MGKVNTEDFERTLHAVHERTHPAHIQWKPLVRLIPTLTRTPLLLFTHGIVRPNSGDSKGRLELELGEKTGDYFLVPHGKFEEDSGLKREVVITANDAPGHVIIPIIISYVIIDTIIIF